MADRDNRSNKGQSAQNRPGQSDDDGDENNDSGIDEGRGRSQCRSLPSWLHHEREPQTTRVVVQESRRILAGLWKEADELAQRGLRRQPDRGRVRADERTPVEASWPA